MDDVQAELARLKAENEALKRQQASPDLAWEKWTG